MDSNDEVAKSYFTGAQKAAASRKCRDKKQGKKTKVKQQNIECIDLSSDEEVDQNDDDYSDDQNDIYEIEVDDDFLFGDTSNDTNDYSWGEVVYADNPLDNSIVTIEPDNETGHIVLDQSGTGNTGLDQTGNDNGQDQTVYEIEIIDPEEADNYDQVNNTELNRTRNVDLKQTGNTELDQTGNADLNQTRNSELDVTVNTNLDHTENQTYFDRTRNNEFDNTGNTIELDPEGNGNKTRVLDQQEITNVDAKETSKNIQEAESDDEIMIIS